MNWIPQPKFRLSMQYPMASFDVKREDSAEYANPMLILISSWLYLTLFVE